MKVICSYTMFCSIPCWHRYRHETIKYSPDDLSEHYDCTTHGCLSKDKFGVYRTVKPEEQKEGTLPPYNPTCIEVEDE